MRRHLWVAWSLALVGLVLGAAWAKHQATPVWPRLNQLALYRSCALGWAAGFSLGLLLNWLLSRRGQGAAPVAGSFWGGTARVTLTVLALLPVALCMSPVVSRTTLRQALAPRRHRGDTRPNLILITIDTLRADHLGVYGDRRGLTPALDAFASEGTVYESAYAAAPWTLASLASLFSLRPPSECGAKAPPGQGSGWYWRAARIPKGLRLISETLQEAGYTTAAELTNPFVQHRRGWRGFEFVNEEPVRDGVRWEFTYKPVGDRVTRAALDWAWRNRREPFFLWVHYMDPHLPYNPPAAPHALLARRARLRAALRVSGPPPPIAKRGRECQALCPSLYAEEVRYADRCVGELLRELREAGVWEHSLIVVTADHGEELFDHGLLGHGMDMYGESLAVPLLVKWPAETAAARRVPQTVQLPSVGATLLEAAGVRAGNATGVPALPRDAGPGRAVYSESILLGREQTSLTTDRWRVIYHPGPGQVAPFEVYDRRNDRAERHDLAMAGAAAQEQASLRRLTDAAARHAAHAGASGSGASLLTPEAARTLRSLGYLR